MTSTRIVIKDDRQFEQLEAVRERHGVNWRGMLIKEPSSWKPAEFSHPETSVSGRMDRCPTPSRSRATCWSRSSSASL
ncbi:hypothetical protein ACFQL0_20085 [Haloplanus litoreus]|uniref:hypothetical protein n=1 Tax=Haloplanus litoreus TaxID=767515 RepID=UPI00361AE1CB